MTKDLLGNNLYNRFMTKIFDLVVISVLTLLCCAPVVTAGAALTSACGIFMKMSKDREGGILKGYFKDFKMNLKESFGGWFVNLLLAAIIFADLYLTKGSPLNYGFTLMLFLFTNAYFCWYFCLRSRFFENTISAVINALKFTVVFLPISMLSGLYISLLIIVLIRFPITFAILPIFGVALFFYIPCLLLGGKIDEYILEKNICAENENVENEIDDLLTQDTSVEELVSHSKNIKHVTKAEGFRKYVITYWNNEKYKLGNMSFKEKIKYIFSYYRGVLIVCLIPVVFALFFLCGINRNEKTKVLNIAVVNSYHSNEMSDEDIENILLRELVEYGFPISDDEKIGYDSSYQIPYATTEGSVVNSAANYSDYDKFFLNIQNGLIDLAIVPESFVEYCDSVGEVYIGEPIEITDSYFVEKAGVSFVGSNAGEHLYLLITSGVNDEEKAKVLSEFLLDEEY